MIIPDWPAPSRVKACVTTRKNGFSRPPYSSFNTAYHVGDDPLCVAQNRKLLIQQAHLPSEPVLLSQVHGVCVIQADSVISPITADASYTKQSYVVCEVQTADCLSVLLCDQRAQCVAAAHAGWRGLSAGILESVVVAVGIPGSALLAWLGPAIGPTAFLVGNDVYEAFVSKDLQAAKAFRRITPHSWLANLFTLAKQRLQRLGVSAIYGGNDCTYSDVTQFFSFRRERVTGRMSSLIWLDD